MAAVAIESPSVIEPDALYVAQEAQRRLCMGEWAWKQFKRRSHLRTTRIGSRVYVKGADIIAAVERLAAEPAEAV